MDKSRIAAVINNRNTTAKRLCQIFDNESVSWDMAVNMIVHPNADDNLLQRIFDKFYRESCVVEWIVSCEHKLSEELVNKIAKALQYDTGHWSKENWNNVKHELLEHISKYGIQCKYDVRNMGYYGLNDEGTELYSTYYE